jgi:predicted RNA-binding Zn-ribbon protein involved in translation (DUF1610 family)
MTIEAQVCPECGAAIKFSKGQVKAVCTYCGATVVKPVTLERTSLKKEIEAEKLGQETIDREIRLHTEGLPATAKILTVQQTDIFKSMLNGKGMLMFFTLEVQPDKEAPFNAEAKAFIGLPALDKYQPGTVLDVRYDPQDHTQVSVEGRHNVPSSNPWIPDEQERKADEMIRKGDEEMKQADAEMEQAEEEIRQADEEIKQADEKMKQADKKRH